MLDTGNVKVIAALHPLKAERTELTVPAGMTIAEIFDVIQPDPMLRRAAHVYIGPHYIPRERWHVVRPKPGVKIAVRAYIPPMGGEEGGGGKDTLRVVLMIAVAAAALLIPGALGFTGLLATGVQAAIGLGGMLLVNALVPPRVTTAPTQGVDDSPTKFIEGARNVPNPFGVVSVPFGTVRIIPNLAADPVTEIIGDDQWLRMLFIWGIGRVQQSDIRIGTTPLANYTDYEIQHTQGYLGEAQQITIYSNVVDQQNFQILLSEPDGFTVRTTALDCEEISVDLVFPSGLISISDDGTRNNAQVTIVIEYAVAGSGVWASIPIASGSTTFPLTWTNSNGISFNTIAITHKRTNAIRHGISWKVPAAAQYDVRIRRATADTVSDNIRDVVAWTTLRTITHENPVQSPVPVALTALRIKATDQLSGVIDELNGLVTRICPDWDDATGTWITRATNNPASMFRFALQNGGLQSPYADAQIDLVQLQYWHNFCVAHDMNFDQNRDFRSSLWDLLADVAAAGRASPDMIDGKWTVVIDERKEPVSHITPRNADAFRASKAFTSRPHGFRIPFNNREQDYRQDELRVFIDGHSDATATIFETLEYPGVTRPSQIHRHARFDAVCAIHRPERWTWRQDMEHLVYRRGDVVLVTYDVLLVGLSQGRIKALVVDGSGDVTEMTVDTPLVMEEFQTYGVSIRTLDNIAVTAQLITDPGAPTTVVFASPIPAADAPAVGDLFGYGLIGLETDKALILDIDPIEGGFDANVTATSYREIVYDIDDGVIPEFTTNLTAIPSVPDVSVLQVRSDETVLTVGAGESLSVHIAVKVQPLTKMDGVLEIQKRSSLTTGEPFAPAQIDSFVGNEYWIGDVRTGEYVDLRFRWRVQGRMLSDNWAYLFNHRVVGKSSAPSALVNMTISTFGGQAFVRWDKPPELDVIFGGVVRFRHSTDPDPTWGNSTSIGNVAQARSLLATLPLKPGTYLARVFDEAGNYSDVVMLEARQASVLAFANVDTLDEAPSFNGAKTNVAVDGTALKLTAQGFWDDIPDIDAEPDIDLYGGVISIAIGEGEYIFDQGFDFVTVKNVRLTVRLNVFISSVLDLIDAWVGLIDERENFDGNDTADCDCIVYVSLTDDDPAGAASWTPYERLDSMEVRARGCRFKAILTSNSLDFNIFVTELGVDAEEIV